MRLLAFFSAALLAVVACNTADPNECFVNTSGGFGASGPIPIGAGVGVSSGGDLHSPPRVQPLGNPAPANPCVTGGSDTAPMGGTTAPPNNGGASVFSGIDPSTLNHDALEAAALAYYLMGISLCRWGSMRVRTWRPSKDWRRKTRP